MVKVAEVTAHAVYFRFSPFFYHQQVMELEAILAVVQEVPEVLEVHKVQKEHQGHQRRQIKFGGDGELVSSPSSFSGLIR